MKIPKALLIIPFYNESERIAIHDYTTAFQEYASTDFLLVNDGSTDTTASVLMAFQQAYANVSTLLLPENAGKAAAIRTAVLNAPTDQYAYIGYLDADLATPITELIKMLAFAGENPEYHFIMGSRIKKMGSQIVRYQYRHYFGRVFATIVSNFILKTPIYDTQCGAKVIDRQLAVQLFEQPFLTRWLFDVELLLRYKKGNKNFTNQVYEYSLNTWIEKGASKITLKDLFGFPFQLLKIYRKYD
ncbi:glycosyltransferase [Flavobacterium sp. UBA4197]|uniref:glycosyltransferase n=1 Tax=Flavobacterium sp. UBA4197 TaxID=1946546 RepID=UPI00257E263A|nr:glycosyltransferase [Flavobacterium sp. UBA4197]